MFQHVRLAPAGDRIDFDAHVQQTFQELTLASRDHGRVHPPTPRIGGFGVFRHAPHDFVVLVHPHQVVRIDRAAAGYHQRAQLGRSCCKDGVARRVDKAVRVSAMRQQ
jgi:hypothetical protein